MIQVNFSLFLPPSFRGFLATMKMPATIGTPTRMGMNKLLAFSTVTLCLATYMMRGMEKEKTPIDTPAKMTNAIAIEMRNRKNMMRASPQHAPKSLLHALCDFFPLLD